MDISYVKFIAEKAGHAHPPRQFTVVKGSFTTVKVSRVTAPNIRIFEKGESVKKDSRLIRV